MSARSPLARAADLPVMVKILSAVLLTLVVGLGVGVLSLLRLSSTAADVQAMYDVQVKPLLVLADAQRTEVTLRLDLTNLMISQTGQERDKDVAKIASDQQHLDQGLAQYRPNAADPGAVDAFVADWQKVQDTRDTVMVPLARRGDLDGFARSRDTTYLPLVKTAEGDLARAFTAESAQSKGRAASARRSYHSARVVILLALLLGSVASLGLGVLVARQITRTVGKLGDVARALARGDLTVRADVTAKDELGRMAAELDTATQTLRETVTGLEVNARTLAESSRQLSTTSDQIAAAAEETGAQAGVVSSAANQVSSNIATVATSSEEMRASIQEIAGNSTDAAAVAQEAVQLAGDTNQTIMKLGTSSAEIGDVVKTIASIAEQTNLLALNATIEAARAGEAGKGFAVVANEVKELAQETARATEDISRRVEAIQGDTRAAVDAIERITTVIGRISDFQATIASAVEEQTATTSEVVRNVSEAAAGAEQIAQNVSGVADAAQTTTVGVTQAQAAAAELNRMSSDLQRVVRGFQV